MYTRRLKFNTLITVRGKTKRRKTTRDIFIHVKEILILNKYIYIYTINACVRVHALRKELNIELNIK
jgi:hypothetical protein